MQICRSFGCDTRLKFDSPSKKVGLSPRPFAEIDLTSPHAMPLQQRRLQKRLFNRVVIGNSLAYIDREH
jgi:hypothetical protein